MVKSFFNWTPHIVRYFKVVSFDRRVGGGVLAVARQKRKVDSAADDSNKHLQPKPFSRDAATTQRKA